MIGRVRNVPLSFGQSVRGLQTSSLRVLETRHALGMVIGRHAHGRACLNFVLQGCYREDYGRREGEFPPLSISFKPAGEPHSNRFDHAPARCFLIEIQGDELAASGLDLQHLTWTRDPHLASLGVRIWHELADPDEFSSISIDEWGLELCAGVLGERNAPSLGSARLRATADVLHDDPRLPWSLSSLARHIGLHPSHLARAFRARHGCTIGEYLRRLRLNEAARQLALGDERISVLSAELGFADQSHCTRAFRRQFGSTPACWQRGFRRTQAAF